MCGSTLGSAPLDMSLGLCLQQSQAQAVLLSVPIDVQAGSTARTSALETSMVEQKPSL